jgi:hypothetical protein
MQKRSESDFRLTQDQVVDIRKIVWGAGEQWASSDRFDSDPTASGENLQNRFALNGHGADKHVIRPFQIIIGQGPDVHVDELFIPFGRKHGGHGQQAQGRKTRLSSDEFHGVPETPERVRIVRVEKENLHERAPKMRCKGMRSNAMNVPAALRCSLAKNNKPIIRTKYKPIRRKCEKFRQWKLSDSVYLLNMTIRML